MRALAIAAVVLQQRLGQGAAATRAAVGGGTAANVGRHRCAVWVKLCVPSSRLCVHDPIARPLGRLPGGIAQGIVRRACIALRVVDLISNVLQPSGSAAQPGFQLRKAPHAFSGMVRAIAR